MRRWMMVGTVVAAAALGACSDDGDDDEATGDVDRYCELTAELDAAGSEFFADLEADESATDEDYAQAEADFIEAHQDDFDEILEAAPEEIRADLEVLLDAQDRRAEGDNEPPAGADEAEERILDFEAESCG